VSDPIERIVNEKPLWRANKNLGGEPAAFCPVRDQLVPKFRRRLECYNYTFSELIHEMDTDKASEETKGLYNFCIEARTALRDHEWEHGCCVDLTIHARNSKQTIQ
jgi:hypothetical protein